MIQATVPISGEDERRLQGAQMAKLGVRLLNKYGRHLQCDACGATWSPPDPIQLHVSRDEIRAQVSAFAAAGAVPPSNISKIAPLPARLIRLVRD